MSVYNGAETLSTCRFGNRAKSIKNKPKVNRELSVRELTMLLAKAEKDMESLKEYTSSLEEELKLYRASGARPAEAISSVSFDEDSLPGVIKIRGEDIFYHNTSHLPNAL